MTTEQLLFSALMLIAGIGIPVMAALNAGFGAQISHPIGAVVILCLVALALSLVLLVFVGAPNLSEISATPPIYFFAGVFFILYIASVTYAAPKIGLANAVFYVLLGQLVSAAIIDHFGLWNAVQSPITVKRIIGILIMVVGVYLARKDVISPVG
ncbi:MAG: DMT family transporter [Pseudomonadota bacterium]